MTRVRYFEGQRLRADDLRAEQEYLIDLERRHNLAQHGPGIVRGLEGGATIRPGVAVDERGRVLVLERPSPAAETEAWLVTCETPFRRRGSCENDRVRDRAIVAGSAGEGAVSLAAPRYTYLTASQVKDPAARAVMQIGPATGRDRNGFAGSTRDAAGVLAPRIALDRLGTNFLLGTTTVSGYRASAAIALSNTETLYVLAKRPGPEGERIRVQIAPEAGPQWRVRFLDGSAPSKVELVLAAQGRDDAIEAFNKASDLVTVRIEKPFSVPTRFIAILAFAPQFENEAVEAQADPVQPPAETPLKARGSIIDLTKWPERDARDDSKIIGCVERLPHETSPGHGANGLSFIPMGEAPKAAPVPGMWSVDTGTPADPRDELRLDLGEARQADASVRFTLGHRDDQAQFYDWMKIRGTSIVTVQDLHVTGQTRVAPLRADHTDRNFATLLVRAYLDGLEAAIDASANIVLAFSNLPALIKTGDSWKYRVTITNGTGQPIIAGRLLETLTPEGDVAPLSDSVTLNLDIPTGGPHLLAEIVHPPGQVPPGMLTIDVRTSGKKGDAPWRTPGTPLKTQIPVVDSPSVDLNGIPESVPANQPWMQSFVVRNNAGVPVTLTSVTMQENANAPQVVAIPNPNVPANGFVTFGPALHAIIAGDLDIVVAATVTWSDATISTIQQPKTIVVRDDLDTLVTVVDPPSHQMPWRYDLTILNKTTRDITVTSITQSITGTPPFNAVLPPEALPIQGDVTVPAGGAVILEDVDGIEVQEQATTKIDLTLVMQYQREDQLAFTFTDERKGISVV